MRKSNTDRTIDLFPRRLAVLREAKRLTQTSLAIATGIPQARISLLESGKRVPLYREVLSLAEALGIDPSEFGPKKNLENISKNP